MQPYTSSLPTLVILLSFTAPSAFAADHVFGGDAAGPTLMTATDCTGMAFKIGTWSPMLTDFAVELATKNAGADLVWYLYSIDETLFSTPGYGTGWWQGDLMFQQGVTGQIAAGSSATNFEWSPTIGLVLAQGGYMAVLCPANITGMLGLLSDGIATPGEFFYGDMSLGGKKTDLDWGGGSRLADPQLINIASHGASMVLGLLGDADADGYDDDVDCDDTDPNINPAAQEVCDANDVDEDCDGLSDDDDPSVDPAGYADSFPDSDSDGEGDDSATATLSCDPQMGMVSNTLDCDDGDPAVNTQAIEVCNGVDDDCNDLVDDGAGARFESTLSGYESFAGFALTDDAEWKTDSTTGDEYISVADKLDDSVYEGAALISIVPLPGSWNWTAYFTLQMVPDQLSSPEICMQGLAAVFQDLGTTADATSHTTGFLGFYGTANTPNPDGQLLVEFDTLNNPSWGPDDPEATSQYPNNDDSHIAIATPNPDSNGDYTLDWGIEFWDGSAPIYLNDGTEYPVRIDLSYDHTTATTVLNTYMHLVSGAGNLGVGDLNAAEWTDTATGLVWELIASADVSDELDPTGFEFGWTATAGSGLNSGNDHRIDSVYLSCPQ